MRSFDPQFKEDIDLDFDHETFGILYDEDEDDCDDEDD